jgi:sporulation protein YlmC with PRC-barrel domain
MEQTTAKRPSQKTERSLILASRVTGKNVFNNEGEHLGYVDDLSIERNSGKVIYAIMSFGGFLRLNEKFHPVPWSLLDYDPERDAFVVPLDKAALKDAPNYDPAELGELGGPSHLAYGERIFGYYGPYGSVPYW